MAASPLEQVAAPSLKRVPVPSLEQTTCFQTPSQNIWRRRLPFACRAVPFPLAALATDLRYVWGSLLSLQLSAPGSAAPLLLARPWVQPLALASVLSALLSPLLAVRLWAPPWAQLLPPAAEELGLQDEKASLPPAAEEIGVQNEKVKTGRRMSALAEVMVAATPWRPLGVEGSMCWWNPWWWLFGPLGRLVRLGWPSFGVHHQPTVMTVDVSVNHAGPLEAPSNAALWVSATEE